MRVIVLGAGIIGVTSAYFLARAGHQVTVIDRQRSVGLETSFANAGQVSPGYSSPWAARGVPYKAIKWLAMKHGPLVVRPSFDARLYRWLGQMLANCNDDAYKRNKGRMLRLAEYSRDVLKELREETGIQYDHGEHGTLQLLRTQKQLDLISSDVKILKDYEVAHSLLTLDDCVRAEPGLAGAKVSFVGGLLLPGDETGDAYLFTDRLAELSRELGVSYMSNTSVRKFRSDTNRVECVELDNGEEIEADAYVVALGSFTPEFMSPLGIDLPVYPVKGYSITVPIVDHESAPRSTVMDETYKIAITRLGDRIRVGGTAELAGFNADLREPRRSALNRSLLDLFPSAGDIGQASFWTGLRPMTPDGTPIVGATSIQKFVSQHRPRNTWLDHGLRLREGGCGRDFSSQAGHRARRPCSRPLPRKECRMSERVNQRGMFVTNKVTGLLAVAFSILLFSKCLAQEELRIVHVHSATGPQEELGKQTQIGLLLGFDYATHGTGIVAGRKIVLIEKDDQGKPDVGKALLATAFADEKAQIAIGPTQSNVALVLLPVAEEYKKVLIVEPAVADSITGERWNKYIFRTGRSSTQDAVSSAIVMDGPDVSIVTVAQDYVFGRDGVKALKASLKQAKVVHEEYLPPATTDFTAAGQRIIEKLKDLPGKKIVWILWSGVEIHTSSMISSFKNMGLGYHR